MEDFKGSEAFKPPEFIDQDMKPILIFQGEQFETSEVYKRVKSLFIGK